MDSQRDAADLRRVIHAFDPNIAVFGVQTMDQYRRERLEPIGFGSSLLAAVGVFALALSCAGLYALIAFGVGARTREIGVRVALGASPRSVVNLFIAEGTRLAVVGAAIGIALSFVMARIVAATFNGVTPNSSATIAVVALVLFGVAVVATWMPARQVAHVDPAVALRGE